jgi:hypothetical protein
LEFRERVENGEGARASFEHEKHFSNLGTILRDKLHLLFGVEKIFFRSPKFLKRKPEIQRKQIAAEPKYLCLLYYTYLLIVRSFKFKFLEPGNSDLV